MRKLNVWITADLSDRLDAARDDRPMQKFVPRLLDEALDAREALARSAGQSKENIEWEELE